MEILSWRLPSMRYSIFQGSPMRHVINLRHTVAPYLQVLNFFITSLHFEQNNDWIQGSWTEEAFEASPCAKTLEHRQNGRCLGSQTVPRTSQAP